MKKFFLFCLMVVAVQTAFAQPFRLISKKQALYSIDWCLKKINSIHPNMYYYTPKPVVDSVFDAIRNRCLSQPGDSVNANWLVAELTRCNHLWDVHTNVWKTSLEYKTQKIFPPIWWREDNRVFLLGENFQINSINDVPIDTIAAYLDQYKGQDENKKSNFITRTVEPMFQYCLDDHRIFPPYSVRGIDSAGQAVVRIVEGLTEKKVKDLRWHETAKMFGFPPNTSGDIFWGHNRPYQFKTFPQKSIAIMHYDEAFFPEEYPGIDSLVHNFFAKCEKQQIKYLFFDISRNSGGIMKSFDILGPYLSFKRGATYKIKYVEKKAAYWENQNIKNPTPKDIKPFRGQIFVYQSYYSGSAAPIFSAIMKVTTNALLVGTRTGQGGIPSFGRIYTYDIPNVNGEVVVPLTFFQKERPKLKRLSEGALPPDIPYPFLHSRRLGVEDCLEIIKLKEQNK